MTAVQLTLALQEIREKLTQFEAKIEEAVEADDFEKADEL